MVTIHDDVTTCSKPFVFRVISTLHSRMAQLFVTTVKGALKTLVPTGAQQLLCTTTYDPITMHL